MKKQDKNARRRDRLRKRNQRRQEKRTARVMDKLLRSQSPPEYHGGSSVPNEFVPTLERWFAEHTSLEPPAPSGQDLAGDDGDLIEKLGNLDDPPPQVVTLHAKKLGVLIKVPNELLEF